MIESIDFVRFRGFSSLRADLLPHAYIVGTNSAGKSTVLEAIALAEGCLRFARRRKPSSAVVDGDLRWRGYPIPNSGGTADDPVRFEFGSEETRVAVRWKTGSRIILVWPEEGEHERIPFFYLIDADGAQPSTPSAVREQFPPVTILPVVTPLERWEELKDPTYVETQSATRLASRHFRNHAWLMHRTGAWEPFKKFTRLWLPEIELLDVSLDTTQNRLAVFYSELGSRIPKELAWAGDGMQIWVQLLWHLYRACDAATVVLDEPEVYLHPDLQRRLVRLLDVMGVQVILASHSADIVTEAPPEAVLWVDRRLGGARRAKSRQTLAALSSSLGSSYNIAVARSLRSRLVIAVDCEDPRVLRVLAKSVGANELANEYAVSILQLKQLNDCADISTIAESLKEILPPHLPAVVLLQGGFRPDSFNLRLKTAFENVGLRSRVLSRPELENHLLNPETIARASGAARETVALRIAESMDLIHDRSKALFTSTRLALASRGKGVEVLRAAEDLFDRTWEKADERIDVVSGKAVIAALNDWLERDGYRPITGHTLAAAARPHALTSELLAALFELDELALSE